MMSMPAFKMVNIFHDNYEKVLAVIAIILSSWMAWHVHGLGLTLALTDQNAHLNFARLTFDSFTPGLSQIGFWPPLLHIIMIPAVAIKPLYTSGLAGFATLLPFLLMGATFLYRLILLLTQKKSLAFLSALIFLANPYILYYAVTPMMEVLFVSNLIAVTYFFALWVEKEKLRDLIFCGVFVTLAIMSRFEGLILLPLLSILIFLHLAKKKKLWAEMEATGILFGFIAVMGLVFILFYSWAYSGSPLTFAGGGWWLRSSLEEETRSKWDIVLSFQYLFTASSYMFTKALIAVSLGSFIVISFVSSRKFIVIATGLILFSPFLYDLAALLSGIPLLVPEFPLPYDVYVNKVLLSEVYLNERYGLYWIGFAIMAPIVLIGILYQQKMGSAFLDLLNTIVRSLFIVILGSITFYHLYSVSIVEKFETIRFNMGVPSNEQIEAGKYLNEAYDYGKILLTRVDNDPVLVEAGIPLKNYVSEGNYLLFDQVVGQPWFFARW
ncbi:glycosyltransferase family 39 protein, partial [bacterium]|nr:glycosyltransferase family 39 protein [bacterium]